MKVTCTNPVPVEAVETFPHLRKITEGSPCILLATGKDAVSGKYIGTILWSMANNVEILDSIWFTQFGSEQTIGIVATKDKFTGEIKLRIGHVLPGTEQHDAMHIAEIGARLSKETLKYLLEKFEKS